MKFGPSLTSRLISNLSFAQLIAVIIAWLTTSILGSLGLIGAYESSFGSYFCYYRARDMVSESITKTIDGSLYLRPTEELREELSRTPKLKFAVFETLSSEPLAGSSPELSHALQSVRSVQLLGMDFILNSGDPLGSVGSIWRWDTAFGPKFIAVSGCSLKWSDPIFMFRNELISVGVTLIIVFSASAGVASYAVRRSLRPLRSTVAAAEKIDMDTLGQGLSAEGAPSEIKPLVGAVNQALKRLDASAARMRRYTANAAHELRTPVAILRARLENPEEASFKNDLKRDARRIQALVEQLLITARLDEQQATLNQNVDLVKTIRQIVADYAPLIYKAGRRIDFEADSWRLSVRGNERAIECVVANLIDNALRAEPAGGTVHVYVKGDGIVEVVDHGEGIAESERNQIFEPFWRKSDAIPGAGLGLAIAKELMDAHRGRIWVETTPGGGATFILWFPDAEQA